MHVAVHVVPHVSIRHRVVITTIVHFRHVTAVWWVHYVNGTIHVVVRSVDRPIHVSTVANVHVRVPFLVVYTHTARVRPATAAIRAKRHPVVVVVVVSVHARPIHVPMVRHVY
jgi:hypothetical protein